MTNEPLHPLKANAHRLDASQFDEIAQLLTLAFERGSGLSQICNAQGEELHRRLRVLFHSFLVMQAAADQYVLSIKQEGWIRGIAIIQEPESQYPIWTQIRGLLQVSLEINQAVAWRLWKNVKILERYHPANPHYYLIFLGVHPNFQGRGYARALLDQLHACSEAHPLSTGVYLETANPQNVPFYKSFGYHLTAHVNIKGVETFIMFRPDSSNRVNL